MHAHIQEVDCARVLESKHPWSVRYSAVQHCDPPNPEPDPPAIQVPTYPSCFDSDSSSDEENQRRVLKAFMITIRENKVDTVDNDLSWSPSIRTLSFKLRGKNDIS